MRPWLRIKPIYYFSEASKGIENSVNILHDFSTNIIQKRKKHFEQNQEESYSKKKRMAMLDLLLKARTEEGIDIDDEGIREEVDTFMFEVSDYFMHVKRSPTSLLSQLTTLAVYVLVDVFN